MTTQSTIRTLALSLLLVSGASHAGLFSKKAKPAPPPPPEPAPVVEVAPPPPPPPPAPIPLEFSGIRAAAPLPTTPDRLQLASTEVLDTVRWIEASKDNAGLPFMIVDKANARVYAFTPFAQLKATAPMLLGMGVGDQPLVSPDAPMSAIPPHKRITPAGRYPSRLAFERPGKQILVIDAKNLISMHIVAKGTPAQRRAERLASPGADDNRVSFGCINVPAGFFTDIVSPDFTAARGIVYVLPETTTAAQLFGFQPAVTAPQAPQVLVGAPQAPVAPPETLVGASQAPVAAPQALVGAPATLVGPSETQASPLAPQVSPAPVPAAAADSAPVAQ